MRTGKILTLIVGGLAALAVALLLAVWLLVNPNDYKGRIAAAVQKATGRELDLKGDLTLSVFPWIALKLGPASLGNPPGFPAEPFLTVERAAVRLRLLPLLRKRLDVGRIELGGLDLKLRKNAAGVGNWEGFGKSDAQAPPPSGGAGETLSDIAGVKITRSRVSFRDLVVENIDLETGAFAGQGVVPVTLHLDVNRGTPATAASVDAHFDVSADVAAKRYVVAAFNLATVVTRPDHVRSEHVTMTATAIDLDLKQQTVSVPALTLNAEGAELSGSLAATHVLEAPQATGTLKLAPLILREWMARVGLPVPATRDPKALTLVAAGGDFVYAADAARVQKLLVQLDDTHLTGSAGVALGTPALTFELAVDGIDLDRYRPPATPTAAPASAPAPAAAKPETSTPLVANGTLAVGRVHVSPLELKNVHVTVATQEGVLRIHPLTGDVDGGTYSGDVTLDSRGVVPALTLDEHLKGVDVGQLLATQASAVRLAGRGNVNIKAAGHGAGADALMKTLDGQVETDVADGAVEGFDLGYELGRAEALLRQQPMPNSPDTHRTPFAAFKMSGELTHGVLSTHDLLISSPVLKITGQGTASLPTQALDFALLADVPKTAVNSPIQIPVKITGTMASPTVRPDVEALAKGALKQKVQDVLKDKLQGVFGKP